MIETESLCPVCKKKLEAELTEVEDKIVITKTCLEHGTFSTSHWQSTTVFRFTEDYDFFKHFEGSKVSAKVEGCPYICELCAGHVSDTVIGVIDVTKKCDLSVPFASPLSLIMWWIMNPAKASLLTC
jgi:uncharacterized radical SAM superfamily Fe-S cluster-containing enzyme